MKERYIDLMEKALSAYTDEHILRYFEEVSRDGLTEHGFPRLTVNIGILIAHGRRTDLLPLFCRMMEFCCASIPKVKAANDFSVREVICCLMELEKSGAVDGETLSRWKACMASIDPQTCYTVFAKSPDDKVRNWALFTGVSEFFRQQYGLCRSEEFIDLQIASQLQWIDENGMYMDNAKSDAHQPMLYDMVPRGLFALLLHFGYSGQYREAIDAHLRKAGLLTLRMQSACGEAPYGGRSNQFLHNEAWLALILEYEANRCAREGNPALAAEFKRARSRAVAVVEEWLAKTPIRHIKNRFPTETRYGCETYAYFDKYMITVASYLHAAYLVCDDAIPEASAPDPSPDVFMTSEHFHKIFLRCGAYSAQIDINADPHYDASGLGRIHRCGAPATIALSVPCPSEPVYCTDIEYPMALSLCPGIAENGEWQFAADGAAWEYAGSECGKDFASVKLSCRFENGRTVSAVYTVSDRGVEIEVHGEGEIAFLLPAFCFDGENEKDIRAEVQSLTIRSEGWACRYTTDGIVGDLGKLGANRNGHYKAYFAHGTDVLKVQAQIEQE